MNLRFFVIFGMTAILCMPLCAQDTEDIEYVEDVLEEEEPVEETRTIAARMTCAEINDRIAELREEIQSEPDLESELNAMLARQRTQCASKARRRPVRKQIKATANEKTEATEEIAVLEETVAPELSSEEIAIQEAELEQQAIENVANGLCPDGNKPNRFGCCAGERFKEVGKMQYACCPKDGDGDCFEPLTKRY